MCASEEFKHKGLEEKVVADLLNQTATKAVSKR